MRLTESWGSVHSSPGGLSITRAMLPSATVAYGRAIAGADKTERSEPRVMAPVGVGAVAGAHSSAAQPEASRGQQHTAGLEVTAFPRCAGAPRDRARIDVDGAVADSQSKAAETEGGAGRSRSTRSFVDP